MAFPGGGVILVLVLFPASLFAALIFVIATAFAISTANAHIESLVKEKAANQSLEPTRFARGSS
jgi:hypothetical protein